MIETVEKYHIIADNIYNGDEKGFLIGLKSCIQKIMTLKFYKFARIRHAAQNKNREFINFFACISATEIILFFALIYNGKTQCLQNSGVENLKSFDKAYFAISSNEGNFDAIKLKGLKQIFDFCTKTKTDFQKRFLIVDEHFNHLNIKFINKCDQLRILLLILPSHFTHRLQFLNVSLFFFGRFIILKNKTKFFSMNGGRLTGQKDFFEKFFQLLEKKFSPSKILNSHSKKQAFFHGIFDSFLMSSSNLQGKKFHNALKFLGLTTQFGAFIEHIKMLFHRFC